MDANQRLADALRNGNLRGVRDALRKGANPNLRISPENHSALYWAAASGNLDLLQAVIEAGAKPSLEKSESTSLHAAAAAGRRDLLEYLLKVGGKRLLNSFDALGYTPLMYAVERNDLDVARCLIAAGADVNAQQDPLRGTSALRIAAGEGTLDLVKFLIAAGADPLLPGRLMLTPLDRARERHTPEGRLITAFMLKSLQTPKPPRRGTPSEKRSRRLSG